MRQTVIGLATIAAALAGFYGINAGAEALEDNDINGKISTTVTHSMWR